jgi:hypothetical protein
MPLPIGQAKVINPTTGRWILVGGPTYERMMIDDKLFCGSKPRSFPVDTMKRARAAIAWAHFDAAPAKVQACARARLEVLKREQDLKKTRVTRKARFTKRAPKVRLMRTTSSSK